MRQPSRVVPEITYSKTLSTMELENAVRAQRIVFVETDSVYFSLSGALIIKLENGLGADDKLLRRTPPGVPTRRMPLPCSRIEELWSTS